MNIRKIALLVAFLGLFAGTQAQNRQLTVEECIMEQRGKLYPATLKSLNWLPGTDKISWLEEDPANKDLERLVILDIPTKNKSYVTLEDVNFGLKNFKVMYSSPSESLKDFKKWPPISWESANVMQLRSGNKLYNFDYTNRGFWQDNFLPAGAQNEDRHKATGHIAYTNGNNLYIKPKNGNEFAITYDTLPGIVNGQSVHRNEFGINKGIFWNNAGNMLAYYHMDESMVTDLSYYGFNSYPGKNTNFRYPMAGQTSHQVKVAVYNTATRRIAYLETGEPVEQYLTNVTWSPDDKYIYVA
ncbi:MAG TPA: DPP IV N-terminal domain-containing protein, partial [Bacteroidia bacterium]|nr:DPP IV N-terminal domain-containing protein [Bacteroidia bacterium]